MANVKKNFVLQRKRKGALLDMMGAETQVACSGSSPTPHPPRDFCVFLTAIRGYNITEEAVMRAVHQGVEISDRYEETQEKEKERENETR